MRCDGDCLCSLWRDGIDMGCDGGGGCDEKIWIVFSDVAFIK